ncbi:MAG: Nif3-like dinuclear metal center hexameric protein [Pseudomonadota bacterium]
MPKINRIDLESYLNEYLKVNEIRDYVPNGLQVEGKDEIKKVVIAVSASLELFEKAIEKDADAILVHHGMLWDNEIKVIKGWKKTRIETLIKSNLSLFAYHLPLDMHEEVGNNFVAAKDLGAVALNGFGDYRGKKLGCIGELKKEICFKEFQEKIKTYYKSNLKVYNFGKEKISKIAVVSGGASDIYYQVTKDDLDVFITGEVGEPIMNMAKEVGVNFIAAGHYNTEKVGVIALGRRLKDKFNIDVEFVDIPNDV